MSATPSAEEQGRSVGAGASDYIKMPSMRADVAEKSMELALHKAETPHRAPPPATAPPASATLEVNTLDPGRLARRSAAVRYRQRHRLIDANHLAEECSACRWPSCCKAAWNRLFPLKHLRDGRASPQLLEERSRDTLQGKIVVFRPAAATATAARSPATIRLMALPCRAASSCMRASSI